MTKRKTYTSKRWTPEIRDALDRLVSEKKTWSEIALALNIPGIDGERIRRYHYYITREKDKLKEVKHKPQLQPRLCNRCGNKFLSWGPGNRRCVNCSSYIHNNNLDTDDIRYTVSY